MAFWKVCAVVLLAACILAKETEVATSDLTPQGTKKSHGYGGYSGYGGYIGGYGNHYSRPIYINNYASSGYANYPSYGYVNRYPTYGYSSYGGHGYGSYGHGGYGHGGYGNSYGHGYRPVHYVAPSYGFGF